MSGYGHLPSGRGLPQALAMAAVLALGFVTHSAALGGEGYSPGAGSLEASGAAIASAPSPAATASPAVPSPIAAPSPGAPNAAGTASAAPANRAASASSSEVRAPAEVPAGGTEAPGRGLNPEEQPPHAPSASAPGAGSSGLVEPANAAPPSTTEIPQAIVPPAVDSSANQGAETDESRQNIEAPPSAQGPELFAPPVHSLQEFVAEGEDASPLGLELREERRRVNTGEDANGLLVVKVIEGSPAEKAGLRSYRTGVGAVLEGLAIGAAIAFPPAILAVPIIEDSQVGQSYDMIIGVDGSRVTNFLEFEDKTRAVRPGDVVYLNILRDGVRKQLKVQIPAAATAAQY